MDRDEITPEILHELLEITDDWRLRWKPRDRSWFKSERDWKAWNTRFAGKMTCQRLNGSGYRNVTVLYCRLFDHHVIYAMVNGRWAKGEIDHIDRDRLNNAADNLRECTTSQNSRNISPRGRSRFLGVCPQNNKWRACIFVGKTIHLGCFDNEEDAARAYDKAAREYHGEFANPNFPEDQA